MEGNPTFSKGGDAHQKPYVPPTLPLAPPHPVKYVDTACHINE